MKSFENESLTRPCIAWDESMSVGVKALDEEHRELLGTLNELHEEILAGGQLDDFEVIIERFVLLIKAHLAHEEELLVAAGCPEEDAEAHHRVHDQIIARTLTTQAGFRCDAPPEITPEGVDELAAWLIEHIKGPDMACGIYLNAQGIY